MRRVIRFLPLLSVIAVLAVASTASAHAAAPPPSVRPDITQVACNSGPPSPIEFYAPSLATTCFGGYVGSMGTYFTAFTMHSGGYYGDFTVTTKTGCYIIMFRPNEVHGFPGGPGVVSEVAISPPF